MAQNKFSIVQTRASLLLYIELLLHIDITCNMMSMRQVEMWLQNTRLNSPMQQADVQEAQSY